MFAAKKGKHEFDDDDDHYINSTNPTQVLIPKESNRFLAIEIDELQQKIYSDLGEQHKMMDILLNNAFDFRQLADPRFSF